MAYYMQHLLRLHRLRAIPLSSPILPMLERLEVARLEAYRRRLARGGPESPGFITDSASQAVARKKDLYYPHGTSTAIENPTYKQVTPGYSTTQSSDPGPLTHPASALP